ncbi:hypothetical protein [Amycolatopsis iheyensis]|nr:hypothetical protein [Amycolatopsis iheyensis]
MINPVLVRYLGGIFDTCGSYLLRLKQNPYEIYADNEIAAGIES